MTSTQPSPRVSIRENVLSVDRCLNHVRSPSRGGICLFIGQVRNHSRGEGIKYLDYEAYEAMALSVLEKLCNDIEGRYDDCALAVEHRVGHLEVGDDAVVIAAASPHRAEAFEACRALIEALKVKAPIWKKETGQSGVVWVGLGP